MALGPDTVDDVQRKIREANRKKADRLTFNDASKIIEERLGRPLNAQEIEDLRALVSAGVTEEELRKDSLNKRQDGEPLFADMASTGAERTVVSFDPVPDKPPPQVAAAAGLQPGATWPEMMAKMEGGASGPTDIASNVRAPSTPDKFKFFSNDGLRVAGTAYARVREIFGREDGPAGDIDARAQAAAGVEWSRFVNQFVRSPTEQVARMQEQLMRAGVLTEEELRRDGKGWAGTFTLQALKTIAYEASVRQVSLLDAIAERSSAQTAAAESDDPEKFFEQQQDAHKQSLARRYWELWGAPAPPGYIEQIIQQGLNVFEFEFVERAKPAFKNSPLGQQERISIEADLHGRFGGR